MYKIYPLAELFPKAFFKLHPALRADAFPGKNLVEDNGGLLKEYAQRPKSGGSAVVTAQIFFSLLFFRQTHSSPCLEYPLFEMA